VVAATFRARHQPVLEITPNLIRELAQVVRDFPGEARVVLDLELATGPRTYELGAGFRVRPEADFFAEVKALLGEAAVLS